MGRLPWRARERGRRAAALVAQRPAAAALLPGAQAPRRPAPAALRDRRRNRDRYRRSDRLRRYADAPPPGREPHQQARGRDPGAVHRLRRARLGWVGGVAGAVRGPAHRARARCGSLRPVSVGCGSRKRHVLARGARAPRARRRRREAARSARRPGRSRVGRQGQARPDSRLRRRRSALEDEAHEDRNAPARALRRRRRDQLRRVGGRCGREA